MHKLQTRKKRITLASSSGFNKFFEKFKTIHQVKLNQAEEDEGLFFLTLLSPSLYFICPFVDKLPEISIIDNMPEKVKNKLIKYYQNSIKRYMYVYGKNKRYLCKNVMSSGKIQLIKQAFPDTVIINPVRHPYNAIPSMIDFYHSVWKIHSPELLGNSKETKFLADSMMELYIHMLKCQEQIGDKFITIKFDELIKNPLSCVKYIYKKMALKQPKNFDMQLNDFIKKNNHKSKHTYSLKGFGLTREIVYNKLKEVFDSYGFEK